MKVTEAEHTILEQGRRLNLLTARLEKMEQEGLARDDKLRRLVEALEIRDHLVDTKISTVAGELEEARCRCGEDKENRPPTSSSGKVSLNLIG